MSSPKNMNKTEKLILDYFKLVNPLPYSDGSREIRYINE